MSRISDDIFVANIALTVNSAIEFQSGDVVGYYHPPDGRFQVRTVQTSGYKLYQYSGSLETVNLSDNLATDDNRQPLIQFTVGKCLSSFYYYHFAVFIAIDLMAVNIIKQLLLLIMHVQTNTMQLTLICISHNICDITF